MNRRAVEKRMGKQRVVGSRGGGSGGGRGGVSLGVASILSFES